MSNAPPPTYDEVVLGRRSIRGYLNKPVPRALIEEVMRDCGGTQITAAKRLGINRNTLHKKWEQVEQEVGGAPDERAIRELDDVPLLQEVEDDHLVALGPDAR